MKTSAKHFGPVVGP